MLDVLREFDYLERVADVMIHQLDYSQAVSKILASSALHQKRNQAYDRSSKEIIDHPGKAEMSRELVDQQQKNKNDHAGSNCEHACPQELGFSLCHCLRACHWTPTFSTRVDCG